ncbi:NAD(P)H-hydrate dehydratase [Cellulomonas palmilytica]|uniref:NAD(P)H-hydrate dehydratase n=1 Tax=Cellulomonas palmilytica TaxID=2608402 RepID=UPI001F4219F7|nr:NAD(P)H-hydrate dehydratase [Cellulomonas palmilytica]UJP39620.1 NAD(P)H-hydrate dehydratase [Cellulomonas palmilytica]
MSAPTTPIDAALLARLPLPPVTGAKDARGRVVVLGGARPTVGAALLAGIATLRVGAGRLTLVVDEAAATPAAVAVLEAGVLTWSQARGCDDEALDELAGADAVLVGPGLADPEHSMRLLRQVVGTTEPHVPLLLDAFALGVLADADDLQEHVRGRTVLTPNGAELDRLLGDDRPSDEREAAARLASELDAVVVAASAVATPAGDVLAGDAATPGLGTSGSGDVLAGAVAGLLAAGMPRVDAAAWGVALHTGAGARLSHECGAVGYLAREVADALPAVRQRLAAAAHAAG